MSFRFDAQFISRFSVFQTYETHIQFHSKINPKIFILHFLNLMVSSFQVFRLIFLNSIFHTILQWCENKKPCISTSFEAKEKFICQKRILITWNVMKINRINLWIMVIVLLTFDGYQCSIRQYSIPISGDRQSDMIYICHIKLWWKCINKDKIDLSNEILNHVNFDIVAIFVSFKI